MSSDSQPLADIVIFTVNSHESACLNAAFKSNLPAKPIAGRSYYDFGLIGGARVFHALTQMGDQATAAAARAAISALKPKLLLCVGVAWGAKQTKWQIGDVLLATRLHDWAHRKESASDGVISRGFTIPPSDGLLQMARTAFLDWPGVPERQKPALRDGLLLSTPILYDDEGERQKALAAHPEAIGGEMEGRGLVWEASEAKVDWIVIKAICDWGAGKNAPGVDKDAAQRLAASNSAEFVRYLLETQIGPSVANARDPVPNLAQTAPAQSTSQRGSLPDSHGQPPCTLEGWIDITDSFLHAHRRGLAADDLRLFYDGQEPGWAHALQEDKAIPRRDIVGKIVERLAKPTSAAMVMLVAAGGEGKSLVLRQAAADLLARGCRVLWRDDEGKLGIERIIQLADDEVWILCSDDSEMIANELAAALRSLREAGKRNVHWLVGARDSDWRAQFPKPGGEPSWSLWVDVWPRVDANARRDAIGLTRQDAAKVVGAWDSVGSLGQLQTARKSERSQLLFEAARQSDGAVNGTFFGAVLDKRFDAAGLRAHLESLLHRLHEDEPRSGKGKMLRSAFLLAAAAEAAGIDGVDLKVVAHLLDVDRKRRRPEILHALGQEALAAGGGDSLRTRAPAIARAAIQLVEAGRIDEDLIEIYIDLVRGTGELGHTEKLDVSYGDIMNCGPRVFAGLTRLKLQRERAAAIAHAVAEAAVRVDPGLLGRRVTQAETHLATGDAKHASHLLRHALSTPDAFTDWAVRVRSALFELAVCEGKDSALFSGLWLTGLSLADGAALGAVTRNDAKLSLAGLGAACLEIAKSQPLAKQLQGLLRATAVLGPRVTPRDDSKTSGYFRRHADAADQLKVQACTVKESLDLIASAINFAATRVTDAPLRSIAQKIAGSGPFTYALLGRAVGAA